MKIGSFQYKSTEDWKTACLFVWWTFIFGVWGFWKVQHESNYGGRDVGLLTSLGHVHDFPSFVNSNSQAPLLWHCELDDNHTFGQSSNACDAWVAYAHLWWQSTLWNNWKQIVAKLRRLCEIWGPWRRPNGSNQRDSIWLLVSYRDCNSKSNKRSDLRLKCLGTIRPTS